MEQKFLSHHGVMGQKWGVRRYQNKDGSLTPAGKDKVSKDYKKEMTKATNSVGKMALSLNVKAYNKAADEFNNGGIEKFNKTHSPKSRTYMQDYQKIFDKAYTKHLNMIVSEKLKENKHYQKAQSIAKKYSMMEFDEAVQKNESFMAELERSITKG